MDWAKFDEMWANRHEEEFLARCNDQKPKEFEGWWRAARTCHFIAMQSLEANDKTTAIRYFGLGANWAKPAREAQPTRVEGVFWGVVCELEAARLQSKLAAAKILGHSQRELERACALDEGFHFAGPLRVLGRLIQLKPLFVGGSLDRAITFYDHALQLHPRNSTTRLYLADALISDRQPARAKTVLRQILDDSDLSNWVWETQRDQKQAQLWLQSRFNSSQ